VLRGYFIDVRIDLLRGGDVRVAEDDLRAFGASLAAQAQTLDPGDLPTQRAYGQGQARGQARNARGEPPSITDRRLRFGQTRSER